MLPNRDHDEVAEARLLLAYSSCRSIAQERRRHSVCFLRIALGKELFKEQVGPFLGCFEVASRGREIASVDHVVKYELLRLEELVLAGCVDEIRAIACLLCNLLELYLLLEKLKMLVVVSHVSGEDHANDSLAQQLLLRLWEILSEVALFLEEDLEGLTCVPVLLHSLIVVAKGAFGHEVDVVDVRFAVVIKVMARTSCKRRDQIKIAKMRHRFKTTLCQHQVQHLSNVSAVQVVVIADLLLVASLDGFQECDQFVVVKLDCWRDGERQVLHHSEHCHHERILATYVLTYRESIEIEAIHRAENIVVLRHASHEI